LSDDLSDIKQEIDEQEKDDEEIIRIDLTNLTESIEDVYESIDDKKDVYEDRIEDKIKDKFEDVKDFF